MSERDPADNSPEGRRSARPHKSGARVDPLREAIRENRELSNECAVLRQQLMAARAAAELHAQRLDAVYRSTSWRLTAPIRGVRNLLSRHRGEAWSLDAVLAALNPPVEQTSTPAEEQVLLSGWAEIRRVIAIGDGDIPPVQIQLELPLSYMARELGVSFELFYANAILPSAEEIGKADLLVIMRAATRPVRKLVDEVIERFGTPLVYIVDDNFDLIDPKSELGKVLAAEKIFENERHFASIASSVIVFSEGLKTKFEQFSRNVAMMPGIGMIEILDTLSAPKPHPDEIRIGYAGAPVHGENVQILEKPLRRILDRYGNRVVVETIGQQFTGLSGHPRYRHFPVVQGLTAFLTFMHSRGWDIGLAPLRDTEFNRSKSDNKYRTHAAAYVPGIYSRVPTFSHVRHDITGLVVDNNEEAWFDAMCRLIEDRALRTELARNSALEVRERNSLSSSGFSYRKLFAAAMEAPRVLWIRDGRNAELDEDATLLESLRHKGFIQLRKRRLGEQEDPDLAWADVVAVAAAPDESVHHLIADAREHEKKVIYILDDAAAPASPTEGDETSQALPEILRVADLVDARTSQWRTFAHPYTERVFSEGDGAETATAEGSVVRSEAHFLEMLRRVGIPIPRDRVG